MKRHSLATPFEASRYLARVLARSSNNEATLEVREDKCFKNDQWLPLGKIRLKPGSRDPHEKDAFRPFEDAVRHGFYEWHLPGLDQLTGDVVRVCEAPGDTDRVSASQRAKLAKSLNGLVHIAQRTGLHHPTFDAGAISLMPFSRPTTVVGDTNSVLQGGLDFIVRFLCPMTRVKIPAIAQMEIEVWIINYFKLRRDDKKVVAAVGTALHEQIRGQSAQRTLLRLELLSGVEIERSRLGADPLRGIVQVDSDQEHKNLDLQVVQQGFADRLIFETAIQHLHHAPPGHPVVLLTSDQGLARMSLSEGLNVIFYEAAHLKDIAGSVLPGTQFNPFTGQMYSVPLTDLAWELAVAFGACRLSVSPESSVEISALGESLSWKPYHAREDLLWVVHKEQEANSGEAALASDVSPVPEHTGSEIQTAVSPEVGVPQAVITPDTSIPAPKTLLPSYKFSTKVMLKLIQYLSAADNRSTEDLMRFLTFTHERKLAEYRGFLVSGGFVTSTKGLVAKTTRLDALWAALRARDFETLGPMLLSVESVRLFYEAVRSAKPLKPTSPIPIKTDSVSNYRCMLELSAQALDIAEEGVYPTECRPGVAEFAAIALEVYDKLIKPDDPYVLTGAWLEELARTHGIHPLLTRFRLEESRSAGHLERYVEGSTPDTRFTTRTFCTLETINGELTVLTASLYEGDFLMPGKGSVSLRLKRGAL